MPGPRLEARTSNPRAIAPVGGSDAPAIAALVQGGLQLFQLNKEQKQKATQVEAVKQRDAMLLKAREDMQSATMQLEQGVPGVTIASVKTATQAIALQYAQGSDEETQSLLFSMAGDATGANSAIPTIAEDLKNTRELQEESRKNLRETGESLNLPPGLNDTQLITEITRINAEKEQLDSSIRHNQMLEQQGINSKNEKIKLAKSAGANLTTTMTNMWENTYHPSKELFNSFSTQQKSDVKTDITRSYDEAVSVLLTHPQLNGLSSEGILATVQGMTHRKDLIIGMLENTDLADFQNLQVLGAKAEANANLKGTVEDQENMIKIQSISQMPESTLLKLIADDNIKNAGNPNFEGISEILSNAMRHAFRKGEDSSGFSGYAPDVKLRSDYSTQILGVFSQLLKEDREYTPSAAANGASEINMIIGIQQDTINNPERYNTKVWDAVLMLGASKQGVVLANNPALGTVKGKFNRQLGFINSSLVVQGNKLFKDDGELLSANKLEIRGGKLVAPNDPKYSERLNMYIQAKANMENTKYDDVLQEWVVDNPTFFTGGGSTLESDTAKQLSLDADAALDAHYGKGN